MENQVEKNLEHEMATGIIWWVTGSIIFRDLLDMGSICGKTLGTIPNHRRKAYVHPKRFV